MQADVSLRGCMFPADACTLPILQFILRLLTSEPFGTLAGLHVHFPLLRHCHILVR
jgi:hypothetical protein